MKKHKDDNLPKEKTKKSYSPPQLTVHGSVEKITGWVGGPWGEFFGGQGSGWNPWSDPSGS